MARRTSSHDSRPEDQAVPIFRYGVLDLAICQEFHSLIAKHGSSTVQSLFSPSFPPEVLYAGPWVVKLSAAPEIEAALERTEVTRPWGFYVHSSVDILSLRHTLRRFNMVELQDPRREVLFRYWDPRVMRSFLQVALPHQLERLFDFIDQIEFADGTRQARPADRS